MDYFDHSKIGFGWFPGFSAIFDPPSDTDFELVGRAVFQLLKCSSKGLYGELASALDRLTYVNNLEETGDFLRLPPESYHVTAWDGLNLDNIGNLNAEWQPVVNDFLFNLPCSLMIPELFLSVPYQSNLIQLERQVVLTVHELSISTNARVLKAKLKPVNGDTDADYQMLQDDRKALMSDFKNSLGFSEKPRELHVSLGYFSNKSVADEAKTEMEANRRWCKEFVPSGGFDTLICRTASLYAFRNMATFYRLAPPN